MHGMAMDRRAMHGPINRTMNRMAMDGTMRAAVAHPAALRAALTNLGLQNHAVVHVRDWAHPADNFDRLGLRQSQTRKASPTIARLMRPNPLHGFFPALLAKPNPAGLALRLV